MTKQEAVILSAFTGYNLCDDFDAVKNLVFKKTGLEITELCFNNIAIRSSIMCILIDDVRTIVENLTNE